MMGGCFVLWFVHTHKSHTYITIKGRARHTEYTHTHTHNSGANTVVISEVAANRGGTADGMK